MDLGDALHAGCMVLTKQIQMSLKWEQIRSILRFDAAARLLLDLIAAVYLVLLKHLEVSAGCNDKIPISFFFFLLISRTVPVEKHSSTLYNVQSLKAESFTKRSNFVF